MFVTDVVCLMLSDTPGHTIPIGQLTDLSSACSQLHMVFDHGGTDNCTGHSTLESHVSFRASVQLANPAEKK